jgi:hypothetical protein
MRWWMWVLTLGGLGLVVDRILLAAEARGWIYYRKNKPSVTSVGTALFQLQAIVQPEKQHVVEQQLAIKEDEDEDGRQGRETQTAAQAALAAPVTHSSQSSR